MISETDSIYFLKQTATLLKAGIPLLRALQILKEQSSKEVKVEIEGIILSLESGETFYGSLKKYKHFSKFIPSFRIAERDGLLEESFLRAASSLEKKKAFRDNLIKMMTYPAIVLGISAMCFLLLIFIILPNFTRMFAEFNCQLPPITRFLISLPNLWPIFLLMVVLCGFLIVRIRINSDLKFKIPLVGAIMSKIFLGEICYNLGSQLKAGVPIIEGIETIIAGIESNKIKAKLIEVLAFVRGGKSLSQSFRECSIFPDFMIQMASVGEESGTLDQMLISAGEALESEGEQIIRKISTLIEPAATLTVGLAVGFIAFSIIMPLFSMMNTLL